jgi:hypothetical protein
MSAAVCPNHRTNQKHKSLIIKEESFQEAWHMFCVFGEEKAEDSTMCKKEDCPIYDSCDKDQEQALYCRKVELLVHLSRKGKVKAPRFFYSAPPVSPIS